MPTQLSKVEMDHVFSRTRPARILTDPIPGGDPPKERRAVPGLLDDDDGDPDPTGDPAATLGLCTCGKMLKAIGVRCACNVYMEH